MLLLNLLKTINNNSYSFYNYKKKSFKEEKSLYSLMFNLVKISTSNSHKKLLRFHKLFIFVINRKTNKE